MPGVPYAEQLRDKRRRLAAWFPDADIPPLIASPTEERFRHKVAFVFGPAGRGQRAAAASLATRLRRTDAPSGVDLPEHLPDAQLGRALDRWLAAELVPAYDPVPAAALRPYAAQVKSALAAVGGVNGLAGGRGKKLLGAGEIFLPGNDRAAERLGALVPLPPPERQHVVEPHEWSARRSVDDAIGSGLPVASRPREHKIMRLGIDEYELHALKSAEHNGS